MKTTALLKQVVKILLVPYFVGMDILISVGGLIIFLKDFAGGAHGR
jgi:hypothetical protein